MTPDELYDDPNGLARYYSKFEVGGRVLLSGHSHQAWPDVAFRGQQQAWIDAARHVDDKWSHAFAKADDVRRGPICPFCGATDSYVRNTRPTEDGVRRYRVCSLPGGCGRAFTSTEKTDGVA